MTGPRIPAQANVKVLGSKEEGLGWSLWLPSGHCPFTFMHWVEPVHSLHGPAPTLPCCSMDLPRPPSWKPGASVSLQPLVWLIGFLCPLCPSIPSSHKEGWLPS